MAGLLDRRTGVTLGLALVLLAGPAAAREPRGSRVADPAAGLAGVGPACAATVSAELRAGEISSADACVGEREAAQRRQLKATRPRPAFGLVERARGGVTKVLLVVSEARGCARWPLRLPGRRVLGLYEVKAADCWVRRFAGALPLAGVRPDGTRVPRVLSVRADGEGRVAFDLLEVDASLRRRGQPGLDAYVRLELGADGWAGSIDLEAMRAQLADLHAAWVQRGRGVPALMVVRHPAHASADRIRGLALEAALRRQEADYKAVLRGALAPRRFRERYPVSPYRQLVAGADE